LSEDGVDAAGVIGVEPEGSARKATSRGGRRVAQSTAVDFVDLVDMLFACE